MRTETGIIDTMTTATETVALWRPAGPGESRARRSVAPAPRLPGQPIFYPVLSEEYAAMIARDWNVRHSGARYRPDPSPRRCYRAIEPR